MNEFLGYFTSSDTPFAILFIALFFYVIKSNKDREERSNKILEGELKQLNENMQVVIRVWKILLEKEVKDHDKLN